MFKFLNRRRITHPSGTDPIFNEKIIFDEKKDYSISDLKFESLDKIKTSNNLVYNLYKNINMSNSLEHMSENKFGFDMITIKPGSLGREHNKTISMELIKPILIHIMYGEGFIIMENSENVKIVNVKKNSFVYIPSNYSFVIVNKKEDVYMSIMIAKCLDTNFKINTLKSQKGSSLYFLNNGFKKNLNSHPGLKLEEYENNYLPNIEINPNKSLYEQINEESEKFEFLNRF